MSSKYIRTTIKAFLASDAPTENCIDLTGEYRDIEEILEANSLTMDDEFLGIQFLPEAESPITVGSNGNTGCYREPGALYLHITEPVINTDYVDDILDRAETLMELFRGATIGQIRVLDVTAPNFEAGATLQFEKGFQSASIIVGFYRDNNL